MATNEDTADSSAVNVDKVSSSPREGYDKKCIFCKIVNKEMDTELLHSVGNTIDQSTPVC